MQSQSEVKNILSIPEGSNLLSVGTFMLARGAVGMTADNAVKLNSVINELSVDACKFLGAILTNATRQTKEVLIYNGVNKNSNVMDEEAKKTACANPNYGTYILTTTMRSMSLLHALSAEAASRGGKQLVFNYSNGITTIQIAGDDVNVRDAPDKVQSVLRDMGEKVIVKSPSRIEKYASVDMPETAVKDFISDPLKSINGVPLVEQGLMIKTGIFEGKFGAPKVSQKPMSNNVAAHLSSDGKELKAFFTTKGGVNKSGTVLPNSNVFFKDGMDIDGIGIKKALSQAIVGTVGIKVEGKKDAETLFRDYLKDENCIRDTKLLYNPSWAAKDLAEVKKNKGGLETFAKMYRNVLTKIPVYIGMKGLKYYLLEIGQAIDISIFTKLPNVVEKLIAYYVLSASVVRPSDFKSFVENFFKFNQKESMKRLVMISLQHLFERYEVCLDLQGIKKTVEDIWASVDQTNEKKLEQIVYHTVDMDWESDGVLNFNRNEEKYFVSPNKVYDSKAKFVSIAPTPYEKNRDGDGNDNVDKEDDDDVKIDEEKDDSVDDGREVDKYSDPNTISVLRSAIDIDLKEYKVFFKTGNLSPEKYSKEEWDTLFVRKMLINVFGVEFLKSNLKMYDKPLDAVIHYVNTMNIDELMAGFINGCAGMARFVGKIRAWVEENRDGYGVYGHGEPVNWEW